MFWSYALVLSGSYVLVLCFGSLVWFGGPIFWSYVQQEMSGMTDGVLIFPKLVICTEVLLDFENSPAFFSLLSNTTETLLSLPLKVDSGVEGGRWKVEGLRWSLVM